MKIKTLSAILILTFLCTVSAMTEEMWNTNYTASLETAKKEGKMVLLDFTGSDWCGWCIKLDKEIFAQKAFKEYAAKNLVLVKLDFPRSKPQTAEIKQQNQELAAKFDIKGYPTVIVLNADGKKVGRLGYMEGGPSAFIAELNKLKN